jgi:UDP-glucuronate 4-epimerase
MAATLVTGAAGFVGSSLCERLIQTGRSVIGVDNFDAFYDRGAKERNLASLSSAPNFRLIEADVRDARLVQMVRDTGEQIESIVHLAAKAGVRPSIADPRSYIDVNVCGTAAVIELARSLQAPLIFGSSSSVYGDDTEAPFREDAPALTPISPYAASKRAAELLCANAALVYGLPCLALRFFTVVGERQRPDLALHSFTRAIADGRPITVFGDGSMRRDFTYVGDILDGVVASLEYVRTLPKGAYDVINLGGHATASILELVRAIESAMGRSAQLHFVPPPPGDVRVTYADISKAHRLLGFDPKVPLTEAARRFVQWFEASRSGVA